MKKIILFLLVAAGLSQSCSKQLEPLEYAEINPSIFPKNESDLQAMIWAAYYPLRGSWANGFFSTSERGIMYLSDATTEILAGKYGDQMLASLHNFNPKDPGFTRYYDEFYNKISQMTLTIDAIEQSTADENLKKKAIAEVKCARGFLAYLLYDFYGPIVVAPLEVLKNPLNEMPLARLSQEEMVKFIEDDLTVAALDLPHPAEAEYGRFSKALAKMVLIRLYLHEKNWKKVNEMSDDIIAWNHFSLDKDYVKMWDLEGAKSSNEVIWAVPCDYAGTSENQWQLMVLPPEYPVKGGWGTIQSTWWFYDTFEDDDVRKTMLISEYTGSDGIHYSRTNPSPTALDVGPIPLKMNPDNQRTTALSTVDLIIFRFADVLLSKAEALANDAGAPTTTAMELINRVRQRAGLADAAMPSSLSDFNDLLLTERSHELWCENGQYRADLIRHGKFVSRCEEVKHSIYTAPNKVLFPFSLTMIAEGKGKFIQNPGYN